MTNSPPTLSSRLAPCITITRDISWVTSACDGWPPVRALCMASVMMPRNTGAKSASAAATNRVRTSPQTITVNGFLAMSWKPAPTAEPIEISAMPLSLP